MTDERTCEDCGAALEVGPELYLGGPRLGQNETKCGPCIQKAAAPIFGKL